MIPKNFLFLLSIIAFVHFSLGNGMEYTGKCKDILKDLLSKGDDEVFDGCSSNNDNVSM